MLAIGLSQRTRSVATDPKLGDPGVRRGTSMVGEKAAKDAKAVTPGGLRRGSAGLGDVGFTMAVCAPETTADQKK